MYDEGPDEEEEDEEEACVSAMQLMGSSGQWNSPGHTGRCCQTQLEEEMFDVDSMAGVILTVFFFLTFLLQSTAVTATTRTERRVASPPAGWLDLVDRTATSTPL